MMNDFVSYPSEDGEEGENDGCLDVTDSNIRRWLVSVAPRICQEAKSYKVEECPESCRDKVNLLATVTD